MSDVEEEIKNIAQIKQEKKELKKQIDPKLSKIRSENMKKALQKKKENFENKNKLKVIEYNISDLINNNESSEEENIVPIKKNKIKELSPDNNKLSQEYKNVMDNIMNNINTIQKRVEKLYIMKKNKPPKQTNNFKNNNNSSDDLLNAIKNKMLNN